MRVSNFVSTISLLIHHQNLRQCTVVYTKVQSICTSCIQQYSISVHKSCPYIYVCPSYMSCLHNGCCETFFSVCSINLLQSIGFFRLTMARSSDLGFRTSPSHYFLQVKLKLQEVPHLPLHQEAPDLSPAAVIQDKFQGLSSNKFSTYLVRSLITSYL